MSPEPVFCLRGTVVHGDGRGGVLGFPTANLALEQPPAFKPGVYASRVKCSDGKTFDAVTNLGVRPTFGDSGALLAETHLLDGAPRSLYGETIEVALFSFLRGEIAFSTASELVAQIGRDVEEARRFFAVR